VRPAPTDTAVVIGTGMIGQLIVQALRMAGVARIVAADLSAPRLALARELGATHTCNTTNADLAAVVAELTDGRGADLTFEAVGIAKTVNLALATLRRGGSAVLVGNVSPTTQDFPLQLAVTRELTILGSCSSAGEYPAALAAMAAGGVHVGPLISAVAPLAEGAAWFARLSSPDGTGFFKIVLTP
jgi:L-iditol 2-dehydrogenase